ncbi:hypothetical protein NKG94_38880 [Micromonospora sp. M12]
MGVLDGATVPEGFDTGCVHGPEWYVRHLAARICVAEAVRPAARLTSNLAAAILAVRADHGGQCDLDHPGTRPARSACCATAATRWTTWCSATAHWFSTRVVRSAW